jgi:hypothetical protein
MKYRRKIGYPDRLDSRMYLGHITAIELRNCLGKELYKNFFSFAFVRNPWDWQVSLYEFMLQKEDHWQHDLVKALGSFDEYIRWRCDGNAKTQRQFIYDGENCLVSFLGKFENLKEEFLYVCNTLSINPRAAETLQHKNTTRRRPYRQYYTDETRALVEETFAEDIETFGYEF